MSLTSDTREDDAGAPIEGEGLIRSGKLAGKTMTAAIWIVALPVLLQQTMAALIGLVDTVLAGRLPESFRIAALDAVSIGSYITWFIAIAMTGLGIGAQAIIARAVGAGRAAESHRALGNAMTLSVAWGVLVGLLLYFGVEPLGIACRLSSEGMSLLTEYIRIIAFSMPMAAVMFVGSMCLHGAGETTAPSVIAICVNIVNIFVSWALSGVDIAFSETLILENPFSFDLYLAGIALGTALSHVAGGVMTLLVMRRGVRDLRLEPADLKLDRSMGVRIARVGLPGFLDSLMMWSANLFVLLIIGVIAIREGLEGVPQEGLQGAHLIAIRWEALSFLPGFAMGTAAGTIAGQFLGAGNAAMARRAILACTGIGCGIMGLLGLIFMLAGEPLTRVISSEPLHLEIVPKLLFICGSVQVFFGVTMVVRQGLRGAGDTTWMFIVTTISSWCIRLPAAWVMAVTFEQGLVGMWWALCFEIVLRGIFVSIRFLQGGWQHVKL